MVLVNAILSTEAKQLPVIFQVDVSTVGGLDFTIPHLSGYDYDYEVDYGDGSVGRVTSYDDPWTEHTYAADGGYSITIKGICETLDFDSENKLKKVISLGNIPLKRIDIRNADNLVSVNSRKNFNSSGINSYQGAFASCNNLEILDLYNLDFETAGDTPYMFTTNNKLKTINGMSTWVNTSNITSFNNTFMRAYVLEEIDFTNWNLSNCSNFYRAFRECYKLRNIKNIEALNSSPGDIREMFYLCSSLGPTIDVKNLNVGNASSMQFTFNNCKSAENIDISGWNTSNISSMIQTFVTCEKLENIIGISDLSTGNISTMVSTFQNCKSLLELDLSKWDVGKLEDMTYTFGACNGLLTIGDVSSWDTSNLTSLRATFSSCWKLPTVIGIENWDVKNVNTFYETFFFAYDLEYLDLSNWDTSSNIYAYRMFRGDSKLTSIGDVSSWTTTSLENASEMFFGCSSLNLIGAWNWDISNVTNFTNFAAGCTFDPSEYDLILENWSTQDVCTNMSINFGTTQFSTDEASLGKNILMNTYGWTIYDGGRL